ncbi:MAG: TauD/TfdA family dioxygenase, partial [Planctomycetes bacterium]|nr:TauD/TfdA family dioxygenase [Planctomycetota bacterium]
TWDAALSDSLPWFAHELVTRDGRALHDWLAAVERHGFSLLSGVPCEPGSVERVAELFGYVRETNYGRHFDVRTVADPINLAYTGLGLSVHTDNPYRDPAPTLQLLHCLKNEVDGGETVLVDGFHCATLLASLDPHGCELLGRHRVPFRFESADAVLEARGAIIETDDRGELRTVRYNNRSVDAFDAPPDVLPGFYRAYRHFTRLLFDPANAVVFKLAPGDLLLLDNRRVLHGRKAFDGAGERWLQGCYADVDSLHSRLGVLRREAATRGAA